MKTRHPLGRQERKSGPATCLPEGINLALGELGLCYSERFRCMDPNLEDQEGERTGIGNEGKHVGLGRHGRGTEHTLCASPGQH